MDNADWENYCGNISEKNKAGQYLRIIWNDKKISF